MISRAYGVGGLALLLMLGTGAFLGTHHLRQKLSPPGVKLEPVPTWCSGNTNKGIPPFIANTNSVFLPPAVLGLTSAVVNLDWSVYDYLPRDTTYGTRAYRGPDTDYLQLGVVLMRSDRTSLHQPEYCLTGAGFQIAKSEVMTVRVDRPYPYDLPVNRLMLRGKLPDGQSDRRIDVSAVFFYWFVSDDEITTSHAARMWAMARDMWDTGILKRWAYVRCFALCLPGDEERLSQQMLKFISASVPEFQLVTGPPLSATNRPVATP